MFITELEKMASAADAISLSDVAGVKIRRDQVWSLLPDFGSLSSVAPCLEVMGCQPYPTFPQMLGKYSSLRKTHRLQRELK